MRHIVHHTGKDRTGLVVALTLAVLGVPDDAIVDDYAKSDAAYKELADRDAMVGALSQVRSCLPLSGVKSKHCRCHGTRETSAPVLWEISL